MITIIAHDIRSTHNIGALLRTAEGLGVDKIYFTGYTPYPQLESDPRLPHIAAKIDRQIHKTALGAEQMISWEYHSDVTTLLQRLRDDGHLLAGLEQTSTSITLSEFKPPERLAILLGSEVTGIDPILLPQLDICLEIPMFGKKESFNVVEAASMAMYHCRFMV